MHKQTGNSKAVEQCTTVSDIRGYMYENSRNQIGRKKRINRKKLDGKLN